MLNRTLRRHRWIGFLGDHVQAFQIPKKAASARIHLSSMRERTRKLFQRVNWRSPILLGFALSLVYWIGLFGWMIAEVNFKAFRYAGF